MPRSGAPRRASRPRNERQGIEPPRGILNRLGRAAICAALFFPGFLPFSAFAEGKPVPAHQGYIIRSITVDAQNVFNPEIPEESGVVGRWGNRLHIVTREETIRQELLFMEGEPYDPNLIEEAVRHLRTRSYLTEVSIESRFDETAKAADIIVHTRDQWSLIIGATFGGTSENSTAGLDFGDKNLLGLGQSLNYSFRTDNSGFSHTYGYRDPTLFGSRYDFWFEHKAVPNELIYNTRLERPFYALATPEAHGVDYTRKSHAEPGWAFNSYRLGAYLGRGIDLDGAVLRTYLRISAGEEYVREGTDPIETLRDNKLLIAADFLNSPHDYAEERYIEKFRQVEDIPLGGRYSVFLGPRLKEFGSTTSDVSASLLVTKWHRFFEKDYLYTSLHVAKNDDQFNDNYTDLQLRYYFRHFPYQSIVGRFQLSTSQSETNRFTIGGTNGLRGYKADEFTGRNQLIINIEDRIFTYRTFFSGIIEPGFVIFTDFANTWYNREGDYLTRLYGSFGAGLRFALVKAPGISLIRVDYGIPMEEKRPPVITIGMEGFF